MYYFLYNLQSDFIEKVLFKIEEKNFVLEMLEPNDYYVYGRFTMFFLPKN